MRRPDDSESFKVKAMLNGIANDVESLLPEGVLNSYRELVMVGEGQVALENLCANVRDYEIEMDAPTLLRLREACELLRVDPRYWRPIVEGGQSV